VAVAVNQVVVGQASRVAGVVVGVCARMVPKRAFGHPTGGLRGLPDRSRRQEFPPIAGRSEISRRRRRDKNSAPERGGPPPTKSELPKGLGGNSPGIPEPAEPIRRNKLRHHGEHIQINIRKSSKLSNTRYRIARGDTGLNNMCAAGGRKVPDGRAAMYGGGTSTFPRATVM
jgi:hypothetical protein